MYRAALITTALAASCAAHAADSCAVQAASLLSQGKSDELAAWFKAPGPDAARSLTQLAGELGKIDEVSALKQQSAGKSMRKSVTSAGLPSDYAFEGSWAAAMTQKQGRVEFQAAAEPGSACKLLALHVHTSVK